MPSASRVQNFRSSVQSEAKRAKGKGFKGGYRDRLDIPKAAATAVLITPGDYEDLRADEIKANGGVPPKKHYHTRPDHGIKIGEMFRGGTCAAGYDGHDDCLCCLQKENKDPRVTTRDKYSVNVLQFALFRKEGLKDKSGKPIVYDEDGEKHRRGDPILGWTEVSNLRDVRDLRGRLQKGETIEGVACVRKKFIDVGRGHLGNIMQIADLAEKMCWCGGNLTPYEFTCAGCEAVLCNVENENLTLEDVGRYAQERARCQACGVFEQPRQNCLCDGCSEPRPLSIFDVVAFIRRMGEGTQSTVIVEKLVPVHLFLMEDGQGLLKVDDEFGEEDGMLVPNFSEEIKKMMPQFDFDKVHKPMTNEEAAALLKCANPFRKAGRDYGAYAKGGDAASEGEEEVRRPASPPRRHPVRG
jgi:hypothetical protein